MLSWVRSNGNKQKWTALYPFTINILVARSAFSAQDHLVACWNLTFFLFLINWGETTKDKRMSDEYRGSTPRCTEHFVSIAKPLSVAKYLSGKIAWWVCVVHLGCILNSNSEVSFHGQFFSDISAFWTHMKVPIGPSSLPWPVVVLQNFRQWYSHYLTL